MREGVVPAAIIAAAVVAFVAYVSFEGTSHAVDFAVIASDATVVPPDDSRVPPELQRPNRDGSVLLVDVSWQAVEEISGGSYAVLVATPRGSTHLGCRPECEWVRSDGLREFARSLSRSTYPLGASFDAEETGMVRVAFRTPPSERGSGPFVPAAWLVLTDGDDVLGAEPVPLS